MISALTLTATVLALTGCGGVATLPLESTQPVADGTEITTDEKEKPDEGATQVDLQETKGTTVTQLGPYGSITLTIPDGWEYHECSAGDDALFGSSYGIQICPAGQKGCVEIGYSDAFGVCGTGLEEKHETVAGADANIGYYDGSKIWSYVVFRGDNEKIVAETWDVDAWWNLDATNRETEGKDSEIATEQDDSKNKEETNLLAYGDQVMHCSMMRVSRRAQSVCMMKIPAMMRLVCRRSSGKCRRQRQRLNLCDMTRSLRASI